MTSQDQHDVDFDDEDDAREDVARLIRGRGLRVAVNAAIAVAGDPKAAAPARATAAGLIIRAAGLFDRGIEDDESLQHHEMTPKQIQRALQRAQRQVDALARGAPGEVDIMG